MAEFDWGEVDERRLVLAKSVKRRLHLSFSLKAEHGFHALDLTDQMLADQPLWRVPFYVIAQRMKEETKRHVIDHAWWLIADDRSGEPWGFVTEPYMDFAEARLLARLMSRRHADWGIEVRALPKERSAWNPGSTVPIVINVRVGCLCAFLRLGVGAALERLGSGLTLFIGRGDEGVLSGGADGRGRDCGSVGTGLAADWAGAVCDGGEAGCTGDQPV